MEGAAGRALEKQEVARKGTGQQCAAERGFGPAEQLAKRPVVLTEATDRRRDWSSNVGLG